jgi:plasmid stabilization system protein ParE
MKAIRFEPEAREELLVAIEWYEEREPGVGARLLAAVDSALESILFAPQACSLVFGDEQSQFAARRKPLNGFPYAVVYLDQPAEIRVLAVAHGRRRPGYWRER